VLHALVHPANVPDAVGGQVLLQTLPQLRERLPRLHPLWVDAAYRGQFVDWVTDTLGWRVEVVKHWWTAVSGVWVAPGQQPPEIPAGFHLLHWR
jgi:hypothetical protein